VYKNRKPNLLSASLSVYDRRPFTLSFGNDGVIVVIVFGTKNTIVALRMKKCVWIMLERENP